ncbi:MAG TPA: hypothetical protein VLB47_14600, partial [Solirubrobacteraceae bacterium]|nr:hypothetical protein [Solirubrobacteraceae bacterium]
LAPPDEGGPEGADVVVGTDTTVRAALSAMLAAAAEEATVVDGNGRPAGTLTVDAIGDLLAAERRGERAIP